MSIDFDEPSQSSEIKLEPFFPVAYQLNHLKDYDKIIIEVEKIPFDYKAPIDQILNIKGLNSQEEKKCKIWKKCQEKKKQKRQEKKEQKQKKQIILSETVVLSGEDSIKGLLMFLPKPDKRYLIKMEG